MGQGFITNWGSFVLLQIGASVITHWGSLLITKWDRRYYKVKQLLQIRATVITKCGSYYKLEQTLLQIRAAITNWGIRNPSPFETTLSKNSLHPSNECFTRRENPKNRVAMFSKYR